MVDVECASCRFQDGLDGHNGHKNPSLVHNSYTEERSHGHPVSTAAPALPEAPVTSIIATSLKSHQLLVHSCTLGWLRDCGPTLGDLVSFEAPEHEAVKLHLFA